MTPKPFNQRTLVKLLSVLEKKERKRFRKYLHSPLQNTNKSLLVLLDTLEPWLAGNRDKDIPFEKVRRKLGFTAATLEKSISKLSNHLRDFIRAETLDEQPPFHHSKSLSFLFQRNLPVSDLEAEFRLHSKKLAALPHSPDLLQQQFQLEEEMSWIRCYNSVSLNQNTFDNCLIRLEEYYATARLKYICSSIHHRDVFQTSAILPDIEELVDRLQRLGGKLPFLGSAYYRASKHLLGIDNSRAELEATLSFFNSNAHKINREDNRVLFTAILNSTLRHERAAQLPMKELIGQIMDSMAQHGIELVQGFIDGWHFRNYIYVHVHLDQTQKAQRFFDRYASYLRDSDAATMIPEMAGLLHFKLGRYPEAIAAYRQLLQTQSLRQLRELQARIIIWRSYFEMYESLDTDQLDEMYRQYDSLRVYLKRDTKLSPQKRERITNFIRLFHKLIRLVENSDLGGLEALEEEVLQTSNVAYEPWLLAAIAKRK